MAEPRQPPRKAGPLQVARTVFSALFGVRRRSGHEQDVEAIKPAQVIVAAIIGAVLFVLALVLLVRFITAQ